MAVLWTSSSCFFPSRFPSLLRVAFFVLLSTVHTDCMPCCPHVVCRIVVILRISWYWAYWWYCRMDLTWYSRSDVITDVVMELDSLLRHVRDRLGRHGRTCFPFTVEYILTSTAALHFSVVGYRVNMFEHGLGEHCFRGGWASQLFRSSKSGFVVARDLSAKSHWLVSCRFHSLEATRTSQGTPGVSVAR